MARPPLILGRLAYFDPSALVKLAIRNEPGSDLAIALWERTPFVYTSWLSYPEVRSAIERAYRNQRLTRAELLDARARADELWLTFNALDLSPDIARSAASILERFPLSGADAVHLAAALSIRTDVPSAFTSWDSRQIEAAEALGLIVLTTLL